MKLLKNKTYLLLILWFFTPSLVLSKTDGASKLDFDLNNSIYLNQIIDTQIKEQYQYSGLAVYLNQVQYYAVEKDTIYDLDRSSSDEISLDKDQWLAIVGRFNVLLIQSSDALFAFGNERLRIRNLDHNPKIHVIAKTQMANLAPELDQIRYNHLWKPFAIVAKLSESTLVFIKEATNLSWGFVVILFAIFIKLLLLPVSFVTAKSQQRVSKINSQLQPRLTEIKQKYDGEKAHNLIMKAHKDLGVSPFYTLKPMLSFLIQIPVLIAVFNALGEMPQLSNQVFLWMRDLSQPDQFLQLGFSMPLLGDYFNLMPIIMTLITLGSTLFHQDKHASVKDNKKQKIKLYLMAAGFLVLFFPFPAVMVMYWAMANLLGFLQQKLMP